MIKSMTGFASLTREDERGSDWASPFAPSITGFSTCRLRLPPALADLETRLRVAAAEAAGARAHRAGACRCSCGRGRRRRSSCRKSSRARMAAAIDVARERGLVKGDLTPGDLLRMPQAFVIRERVGETEIARRARRRGGRRRAGRSAIDQLEAMRVREGEHLAADLGARKAALGGADRGRSPRRPRRARGAARRGLASASRSCCASRRAIRMSWRRRSCASRSARTSPRR